MGEKIAFENGRISDFQGLVTMTLDWVMHTHTHSLLYYAYKFDRVTMRLQSASLIDFYLHTKFHWNQINFFVDRQTDGRMYGRTFETHFIKSTRKSRPKKYTTT